MVTFVRLFRKRGFENTQIGDIIAPLEICQPTFFRYFPSKDAVLRELVQRAFVRVASHLESEVFSNTSTVERLQQICRTIAREVEGDREFWRATVRSGMCWWDAGVRGEAIDRLLSATIAEGQARGEIVKKFPPAHLAEFLWGFYTTVIRRLAVDSPKPHDLSADLNYALEFFWRAVRQKSG